MHKTISWGQTKTKRGNFLNDIQPGSTQDHLHSKSDFKVIDCSIFFNELDLLRLRINILDEYVDHFVIVEARQTFTGLPKRCILDTDCAHDIASNPKVTIKIIDLPYFCDSAWERENYQRESIYTTAQALATHSQDIILLSDVDEIPSPRAIRRAIEEIQSSSDKLLAVFEQRLFYFRLNYELVYSKKLPWLGTTAIKAGHKVSTSSMRVTGRNLQGRKHKHLFDHSLLRKRITHGGWHFSYLGNDSSLANKFQSFSHQEAKIQTARTSSVHDLIKNRSSLFPKEAHHEIWAIVPADSLDLPKDAIKHPDLPLLFAELPCTPPSEIINDYISKKPIMRLKRWLSNIAKLQWLNL